MRNLLITLRFDGSHYHGFQVQKNAVTVCERVQDAIEKATGVRSDVKGCSRTDAGVHALEYCLSFKTESGIAEDAMIPALNVNLPRDIVVMGCVQVKDHFHARYDVVSKEYVYRIFNAKQRDPFWEGRALHYPAPLDADALNECAKIFCGRHDFKAFCSSGSNIEDTVRTVYSCSALRSGELVEVSICADGFLYNMVRIVVGTLLYVNEGKIAPHELPFIIDGGDRDRAGPTAPPWGLYLKKVTY